MLPTGPLMMEHRIIERMVKLMNEESHRIEERGRVDLGFIDATLDFLRTYADRCHHGKEEGILFKDLAKRCQVNRANSCMN